MVFVNSHKVIGIIVILNTDSGNTLNVLIVSSPFTIFDIIKVIAMSGGIQRRNDIGNHIIHSLRYIFLVNFLFFILYEMVHVWRHEHQRDLHYLNVVDIVFLFVVNCEHDSHHFVDVYVTVDNTLNLVVRLDYLFNVNILHCLEHFVVFWKCL